MEIITILLICDDLDYAYTLAKCVAAKNNKILFTVISRSQLENENNLKEYDFLLLDGEYQDLQSPFIQLVEKRVDFSTAEGQQFYIYKYESVNYFESQILFLYGVKTGRRVMHVSREETRILAIHGTRGGTGKTSIALGLAQELRRFHDKSVLYINYEEIESTDSYFRCTEGCKTISDYLYYMNSGKDVGSYIHSFTVKDEYGIEAFVPSEGRNELKFLNAEGLNFFMRSILDCGGYDFVIIDCDISLNEECLWILSISDQIFMVDNYINGNEQNKWQKYLSFKFGECILKKMILVQNFYKGNLIGKEEGQLIDYDEDSFETEKFGGNLNLNKISIDKEFGLGIKELSTKLTLNLH